MQVIVLHRVLRIRFLSPFLCKASLSGSHLHIDFVPPYQRPMLWFFKYFRRKIQRKKLAFLTQNKAKLCKILIVTLAFEKNAIFCRKLSKIAENCDHNIDPWFQETLINYKLKDITYLAIALCLEMSDRLHSMYVPRCTYRCPRKKNDGLTLNDLTIEFDNM
jgi:hypothetical protein